MSCLHPFQGALFVITVFALIKIYVTAPWAVMKWINLREMSASRRTVWSARPLYMNRAFRYSQFISHNFHFFLAYHMQYDKFTVHTAGPPLLNVLFSTLPDNHFFITDTK